MDKEYMTHLGPGVIENDFGDKVTIRLHEDARTKNGYFVNVITVKKEKLRVYEY